MKNLLLSVSLLFWLGLQTGSAYTDHRNHNVDSLEVVMAGWNAADLASASESELDNIVKNLDELMYGFLQTNTVKSEYYARMMLEIAGRMHWPKWECAACKIIGQHFWHREQYDSAAFYYRTALDAAGRIPDMEQRDKDDAFSSMYGTLGNLYSMMDSTDLAMEHYGKAGAIFKKHGWNENSATLYYNMGETMRYAEEYRDAEKYYLESLEYSKLTGDSLAIAKACKGLGSLYLDTHRTARAMRYLADANLYFAEHEDEELQSRMESLDYTEQVRALQNRRLVILTVLLAAALLMTALLFVVTRKLKKAAKDNKELTEVLEDTVEAIGATGRSGGIKLKPREHEVLDLIAKGYTNADIAAALNLSPETIKWYKKKLFAMFGAANSAELVKDAKDEGVL